MYRKMIKLSIFNKGYIYILDELLYWNLADKKYNLK